MRRASLNGLVSSSSTAHSGCELAPTATLCVPPLRPTSWHAGTTRRWQREHPRSSYRTRARGWERAKACLSRVSNANRVVRLRRITGRSFCCSLPGRRIFCIVVCGILSPSRRPRDRNCAAAHNIVTAADRRWDSSEACLRPGPAVGSQADLAVVRRRRTLPALHPSHTPTARHRREGCIAISRAAPVLAGLANIAAPSQCRLPPAPSTHRRHAARWTGWSKMQGCVRSHETDGGGRGGEGKRAPWVDKAAGPPCSNAPCPPLDLDLDLEHRTLAFSSHLQATHRILVVMNTRCSRGTPSRPSRRSDRRCTLGGSGSRRSWQQRAGRV